jgi:translation initiation factor 1
MSDPKDSPFARLAALRDSLPAGEAPPAPAPPKSASERSLFLDKVVVRFTRKGHGGKTVTVVTGVAPHALAALAGELKRALGCGARVEDGAIVLQGELVERAVAFLEKKGAARIVRGS